MDKALEEKLKNLRTLYLDKRPDCDEAEQKQQFAEFAALSNEEKEKKVLEHIDQVNQKLAHLEEKMALCRTEKSVTKDQLSELSHYIEAVKTKKLILEQKLDYIRSGETDLVRKEKLKRQLADLELKRCKAQLSNKNCSKIEQKIALKKELMKRVKN